MARKKFISDGCFTDDFSEELKCIKKINRIGKKLSLSGNYNIFGNMIIAYDAENPHVSKSVILSESILEALKPFRNNFVHVDGNKLYSYLSKGKFIGYKETDDGLVLKFSMMREIKDEFDLNKFVDYAVKKGLTKYDVIVASAKGFETNMDVYNAYIKYMNTLTITTKEVNEKILLEYCDLNDRERQICMSIITDVDNGKLVCMHVLNDYDIDNVNESEIPVEFVALGTDGKHYTMRIMKSMFQALSDANEASIKLYDVGKKFMYSVQNANGSDFATSNIFKIFPI